MQNRHLLETYILKIYYINRNADEAPNLAYKISKDIIGISDLIDELNSQSCHYMLLPIFVEYLQLEINI